MCTGNTKKATFFPKSCAVYPCVYREHRGHAVALCSNNGLSLCVQGTLIVSSAIQKTLRFIPVCTGNTTGSEYHLFRTPVYPCVYREHINDKTLRHCFFGLSLCVQGTLSWRGLILKMNWFIPVCTGNTRNDIRSKRGWTVYPCVYREHEQANADAVNYVRFIPVCTGNTLTQSSPCSPSSVYPCVYREHRSKRSTRQTNDGLSLCVQGTQYIQLGVHLKTRFIPVCTGNTFIHSTITIINSVYPCVYREHVSESKETFDWCGLSLCVQGTRQAISVNKNIKAVYPCVYREHS